MPSRHTTQSLSKNDLRAGLSGLHDAVHAELRATTKDLVSHFSKQFDKMHQAQAETNTKLDAIMNGDVLVTRSQLLRVFAKLKAQGVPLMSERSSRPKVSTTCPVMLDIPLSG